MFSGPTGRVNTLPALTTQPIGAVAMAGTSISPDSPTSKRSTLDIAWAAGFMEGEGSFGYYGSARASAAQVQREPIDRLQRIFGGDIHQRTTKGFGSNPLWVWRPSAALSVQVMMTLYVLMSPKRQAEIRAVLDRWKGARRLKGRNSAVCANGHQIEGANLAVSAGYARCRICRNDTRRRWRAARKASGLRRT